MEVRRRGSWRLRLAVLPDASADSLTAFVTSTTTTSAVVHTDGWPSYKRLAKLGYEHRPLSQRAAAPGEQLLPRAHRAVSNLKTWMHGTHRGVSDEHLAVYLDEFVLPTQPPPHPDGTPQWPPSRRCSGSALSRRPRPLTRSPDLPLDSDVEPTGYALRLKPSAVSGSVRLCGGS